MRAAARLRGDRKNANELEVFLHADPGSFEVFPLSLLLFCLSLVLVRPLLSLELQHANVGYDHVLSMMRLDVATESERFFAKEAGHSGMRWGLYPMAIGWPIA